MNALTVHQPYAAFLAAGIKKCETRTWPAPKAAIGEQLNIHASKKYGYDELSLHEQMIVSRLVRNAYHPRGLELIRARGAIIAIGTLAKCLQVDHLAIVDLMRVAVLTDGSTTPCDGMGNFAPGRWLWFMEDVEVLPEFVPIRGKLGIWRVDSSDLTP